MKRRYQTINIFLAAGTVAGVVRKTVELFKDVNRCTGVYVVGNTSTVYGDMYLTVKDNVRNHINRLSLDFLIGSLSRGEEVNIHNQLFLNAGGKRLEIELEHGTVSRDMVVSVVFELDSLKEIPENTYGYYQKEVTIPATTTGIYKTPLFNIPSDYSRIIGVRVEGYRKTGKGGVFVFADLGTNVHNISLRTESELMPLDFVPQKMLQPQIAGKEISGRFFDVNIPVTDALSVWFDKVGNVTYVNDFVYQVTFLLI